MVSKSGEPSPVTDEMQELWASFCEFHALCLEASNDKNLIEISDKRAIKRLSKLEELPWAREYKLSERETTWFDGKEDGREINLALLSLTKKLNGSTRIIPIVVTEISDQDSLKTEKLSITAKEFHCSGSLIRAGFDDELIQEIESNISELNEKKKITYAQLSETLEKIVDLLGTDYEFVEVTDVTPLENKVFIDWYLYQEPTSESVFSAKAIKELRELALKKDWYKSPLALLFDLPEKNMAEDIKLVLAPITLNESQEAAIKYSQSHPVTIITGPPGTGKSQVISSLVSMAWFESKSIVVTSFNNAAVDVAVERIKSFSPLAILRTGKKEYKDDQGQEIERADLNLTKNQLVAIENRDKQLQALAANSYVTRSMRFEKNRRLIEAEAALAETTELVQLANLKIWDSSEMVNLVEPYRLVRKSLGKYIATTNSIIRWWHSFRLKRNLPKEKWNSETLEWLDLCVLQSDLMKDRSKFESSRLSFEEIEELDTKWVDFSNDFICNRVLLVTNKSKKKFLQLGKDLQATGQSHLTSSTLEIAPAWATTALTISKDFKLISNSIDTLVIDEASQTSLSAAIPLIYRANKLVLLGDPNQLEPVIKINETEEAGFARKAEIDVNFLREKSLNHKKNSVFAAFSENIEEEAHYLLDEHYRCHSVIAHWFNSQFYNGRLLLLGSRNLGVEQGINLNPVYGELVRSSGSWENRAEADKVVEILRAKLDPSLTVGVVTPFRSQADLIRRLVKKSGIETEIAINTAHKFQGSERDVMIYSTVITEKTPQNTYNWLKDQKNLINVAVSRAKELLYIVGNPEAARNQKTPELAALWEAAEGQVNIEDAASWIQTEAERSLFNGLLEVGILATPQMRIGGLTVDLAVSSGMVNLAIEVDGKSHFDERGLRVRADFQRDRILRDHGWTVYRVPNWRVYSDLPVVVEEIRALL